MAKGGYFHDATGIARKLTKGYYFDASGIARKIKKAYRFDASGIARPCWSGGELAYYGTADGLSKSSHGLAAATVGNYALFAGGRYTLGQDYLSNVTAYDASLTRSTPTGLATARAYFDATTIGNYALFGGGLRAYSSSDDSPTPTSRVDAYNTSCTRTTPTTLSQGRGFLAATTVGNYALFAGGRNVYNTNLDHDTYKTVDAYDTSLTRSVPTELDFPYSEFVATTVGNYAIFYVGARFYTYDTSLTQSVSLSSSNRPSNASGATTVGNYALFGGGSNAVIRAFNTSLTQSNPTELSVQRADLAATTVGDYALFGGGTNSNAVDAYDASLTRSNPTELSVSRGRLAATAVGNYALFGGGMTSSTESMVVDVYTVA